MLLFVGKRPNIAAMAARVTPPLYSALICYYCKYIRYIKRMRISVIFCYFRIISDMYTFLDSLFGHMKSILKYKIYLVFRFIYLDFTITFS